MPAGHGENHFDLNRCPLFRWSSGPELQQINQQILVRKWSKRDILVRESDPGGDIHVVIAGRVLATRYSASGREVAFRIITSGDYFGEIAAIDQRPQPANFVALTDAHVATLAATAVTTLMAYSLPFCRALLEGATGELRRLQARIFEINTLTLASRLRLELLRMAVGAGVFANRATILESPTHAELASLLGGQREAISREMRRLQNSGILRSAGRALSILDVNALSKMVKEGGADIML
jgi:CRP-like cAMP-binding protein